MTLQFAALLRSVTWATIQPNQLGRGDNLTALLLFPIMKIKLLSSVAIAGVVRKIGDELDVEKMVGNDLIHRKRAVSLEAAKEAQLINSEALAQEVPKRGRGRPPSVDADEVSPVE